MSVHILSSNDDAFSCSHLVEKDRIQSIVDILSRFNNNTMNYIQTQYNIRRTERPSFDRFNTGMNMIYNWRTACGHTSDATILHELLATKLCYRLNDPDNEIHEVIVSILYGLPNEMLS